MKGVKDNQKVEGLNMYSCGTMVHMALLGIKLTNIIIITQQT